MNTEEYYYPEPAWEIIKSYILTFDKTRKTKTAMIMKDPCDYFTCWIESGQLEPDTTFYYMYFKNYMIHIKTYDYRLGRFFYPFYPE